MEKERSRARNILENKGFVTQEGSYWGGGKCDWFVIGGRWSGILTQALGQIPIQDTRKKTSQRDTYNHLGYDDDSMVLTRKLLDGLQHNKLAYLNGVEVYDEDNYEEKLISDLTTDDIGKVIVVVDYHI